MKFICEVWLPGDLRHFSLACVSPDNSQKANLLSLDTKLWEHLRLVTQQNWFPLRARPGSEAFVAFIYSKQIIRPTYTTVLKNKSETSSKELSGIKNIIISKINNLIQIKLILFMLSIWNRKCRLHLGKRLSTYRSLATFSPERTPREHPIWFLGTIGA